MSEFQTQLYASFLNAKYGSFFLHPQNPLFNGNDALLYCPHGHTDVLQSLAILEDPFGTPVVSTRNLNDYYYNETSVDLVPHINMDGSLTQVSRTYAAPNTWTIECQIRLVPTEYEGTLQLIPFGTNPEIHVWTVTVDATRIRCGYNDITAANNTQTFFTVTNEAHTWTHYAITYDGTHYSYYYNGVRLKTEQGPSIQYFDRLQMKVRPGQTMRELAVHKGVKYSGSSFIYDKRCRFNAMIHLH
jgi:hypothetical protein